MRLIVTAGGSGGHIFPALSLIQVLEKRVSSLNILFISTKRRLDGRLLNGLTVKQYWPKAGNYRCEGVAIVPPPHRPSIVWLGFLCTLICQTIKVYPMVKGFRPDLIIGFGGCATLPALLTARFLRIPIMLHEQNVRPGLANRFLSRFAERIAVSFPETLSCFRRGKVSLAGNPVRREVIEATIEESSRLFPRQNGEFRLLVMGGSQGSERLNEAFLEALPEIIKEYSRLSVIHITGDRMVLDIEKRYKEFGLRSWVFPFLEDIGLAYKASDLILGRAGATSIAEITALGKPTILIPHPSLSSGQAENAKVLRKRKAAIIIEEDKLTPQSLKEKIVLLLRDRSLLSELAANAKNLGKPDAAAELARMVENEAFLRKKGL